MTSLKVHDLIRKRALVTRQSAEPIRRALADARESDVNSITLDFSGVDAVTPSFVDELLAIFEMTLSRVGDREITISLVNPPTRLSTKFAAVARARGFDIVESENGTWVVTLAR